MNETKSALPTAEALRALFAGCADYTERLIRCGLEERLLLPVCWLDGVVAGDALGLEILRPLTELLRTGRLRSQEEALERCLAGLIYRCSAERRSWAALSALKPAAPSAGRWQRPAWKNP